MLTSKYIDPPYFVTKLEYSTKMQNNNERARPFRPWAYLRPAGGCRSAGQTTCAQYRWVGRKRQCERDLELGSHRPAPLSSVSSIEVHQPMFGCLRQAWTQPSKAIKKRSKWWIIPEVWIKRVSTLNPVLLLYARIARHMTRPMGNVAFTASFPIETKNRGPIHFDV